MVSGLEFRVEGGDLRGPVLFDEEALGRAVAHVARRLFDVVPAASFDSNDCGSLLVHSNLMKDDQALTKSD